MDFITKFKEFKEAWTAAREDGKITGEEMANLAVELGEFLTEAGKFALLVIFGKSDSEKS